MCKIYKHVILKHIVNPHGLEAPQMYMTEEMLKECVGVAVLRLEGVQGYMLGWQTFFPKRAYFFFF